MGPEWGTPEYQDQVDQIVKFLGDRDDLTEEEVDLGLMMYVMDTSFARGAICQARKEIIKKIKET